MKPVTKTQHIKAAKRFTMKILTDNSYQEYSPMTSLTPISLAEQGLQCKICRTFIDLKYQILYQIYKHQTDREKYYPNNDHKKQILCII